MVLPEASLMSRKTPFEDLPVGACFAFAPDAKQATRRKVDERHTVVIPGGKRPLIIDDVETRVHAMACPVSFGRRRRRRTNKKRSR
jgi:hypothetical protein